MNVVKVLRKHSDTEKEERSKRKKASAEREGKSVTYPKTDAGQRVQKMDSSVIVDAASKFGQGIDLDRSFPGFPFNEDEDDSSDGIRAHLDDLASRHPEFAEHLLGPPWSDVPFHGSLLRGRRRRCGSGSSGGQGYQGHQVDEDAHSQASGSSAASGASAVSSHSGEADSSISTSIPQYGLRNTVDIGQQQRRDMENLEKSERGQRSMSAPPENQQSPRQQQSPGQRFISRVDITPQHNQQQQPRGQSPKPSSSSSNVRHIPIFVEGRDEPVMPKVTDDASPPSFQRQPSPPHFHRPSHFNDHFTRQQWSPQFQNAFYDSGFEQPMRRQQKFQPQHQQQPQYFNQQNQSSPSYQQHQQPQQPQYHQRQPSQQQQQEILKPKPPVPKDLLERVALIQKEVDDLAEQVQRYIGGSRQDKEYVYLDEMLTRELIKLDDIETEGRENVRQARKNAIKSIQDTISLLETKAPFAGQQSCEKEECIEKDQRKDNPQIEPMEVDLKEEKQINEPIPLPPAPSSPTKTKADSSENENSTATIDELTNQDVTKQQDTEQAKMVVEQKTEENMKTVTALTSTTGDPKRAEEMTEDTSKLSGGKDVNSKHGNATQTTERSDSTATAIAEETKEGENMEVDRQRTESPSLQKKAKKTKKQQQQQEKQQQQQSQQPVFEQAIPLPPPPAMDSAK